MKPNFTIEVVPLIVRPRHDRGVDWGAVRKVVARSGQSEIWWVPGSTCRIGIGFNEYFPAELKLVVDVEKGNNMDYKTLHEGGKLSRRLLEECNVNKLLSVGLNNLPDVAGHWKPKHTVIVKIAADYIKGVRQ
jgi:hypothetical protein